MCNLSNNSIYNNNLKHLSLAFKIIKNCFLNVVDFSLNFKY